MTATTGIAAQLAAELGGVAAPMPGAEEGSMMMEKLNARARAIAAGMDVLVEAGVIDVWVVNDGQWAVHVGDEVHHLGSAIGAERFVLGARCALRACVDQGLPPIGGKPS